MNKEGTRKFLEGFLNNMSVTEGFDGEKTWVIFFLMYGLELLSEKESYLASLSEEKRSEFVSYLLTFRNDDGKGVFSNHLRRLWRGRRPRISSRDFISGVFEYRSNWN